MPSSFKVHSLAADETPADYARSRTHMVESQLRPNGVRDEGILKAMGTLPRELFVPSMRAGVAYVDADVPLLPGRTLMQPMILARLIQAAALTGKDKVLDLAPATGYSSLVLAALAAKVYAVEPDAVLCKELERNAVTYGTGKIEVLAGDPAEGCLAHEPFDVILINGAVDLVPPFLLNQLAEEGRLLAVVREYGSNRSSHTGRARLYTKRNGQIAVTALFDANISPAPSFQSPQVFSF